MKESVNFQGSTKGQKAFNQNNNNEKDNLKYEKAMDKGYSHDDHTGFFWI